MRAAAPIALLVGRGSVRQPLVYVSLVAIPTAFFVVLTLLAGARLGQHALIGAIVGFAANGGVVSLPQTVLLYQYRGLQDLFVASPTPRLAYVTGLAVSRLIYVAPPVLAASLVFALVADVPPVRLLAVLPLAGLCWVVGCLLGFAVVRTWATPASVSALSNMLGILLVLLPPVYYPLALLPDWLHWPVLIIPTANCAELMRIVLGISSASAGALAVQAAILVAVCAGALRLALGDQRWQR